MKYSCFDARSGVYHVYQDASTVPVNGDLGVPSYGADVNGIGVPAGEAGRRLPPNVQFVGTSWRPVGIVTQCAGGFIGAFEQRMVSVIGCAAVLFGAYLVYRLTK